MGAKPAIAQMLDELRGSQPRHSEHALQEYGMSYRTTIRKKSVLESGCDNENPGKIPHYYYPKHDVILIDLGGNFGDE